jgi:hypothetical protein
MKFLIAVIAFSSSSFAEEQAPAPQEEGSYTDMYDKTSAPSDDVPAMEPLKIDDSEYSDGQDEQPFPFRMGPSISLTLPHFLNYSIDAIILSRWGISFNLGSASRTIDDVEISSNHIDGRIRWFPWAASFFVGVGYGRQNIAGKYTKSIEVSGKGYDVATEVSAKSSYYIPHIGWMWLGDSGFHIGVDAGAFIPQKANSSISASYATADDEVIKKLEASSEYGAVVTKIQDGVDRFTKKTLPFVTMLRIGYMF